MMPDVDGVSNLQLERLKAITQREKDPGTQAYLMAMLGARTEGENPYSKFSELLLQKREYLGEQLASYRRDLADRLFYERIIPDPDLREDRADICYLKDDVGDLARALSLYTNALVVDRTTRMNEERNTARRERRREFWQNIRPFVITAATLGAIYVIDRYNLARDAFDSLMNIMGRMMPDERARAAAPG